MWQPVPAFLRVFLPFFVKYGTVVCHNFADSSLGRCVVIYAGAINNSMFNQAVPYDSVYGCRLKIFQHYLTQGVLHPLQWWQLSNSSSD
jgi:hypothetical protein